MYCWCVCMEKKIMYKQCQIQVKLTAELKHYYKYTWLEAKHTAHDSVFSSSSLFAQWIISLLEFVSHCDRFHSCEWLSCGSYILPFVTIHDVFRKNIKIRRLSSSIHIFRARKCDTARSTRTISEYEKSILCRSKKKLAPNEDRHKMNLHAYAVFKWNSFSSFEFCYDPLPDLCGISIFRKNQSQTTHNMLQVSFVKYINVTACTAE